MKPTSVWYLFFSTFCVRFPPTFSVQWPPRPSSVLLPVLFQPSRYNITLRPTTFFDQSPVLEFHFFFSPVIFLSRNTEKTFTNCFVYQTGNFLLRRFFFLFFTLIQDFDKVCSIIISYHLTDSLIFCFSFLMIWVGLFMNHSFFIFQLITPFVHEVFFDCPATRPLSLFFLHHQNTHTCRR